MCVPALVDSAKCRCTRGGAGLVDLVVALMLLAVALGALAATSHDDSPVVAVACCVVMAGAVALRRRMPTLTVVAALIGLVGYVLATHDPSLVSPPVAVVLTFYTLGRCGATGRRVWRLGMVAGLGLAATWTVSAQLEESPGTVVSSWLVLVMAPLVVGLLLARRSRMSRRLADAVEQLRAEQDLNAAQATTEERNRVARDLHDVVAHCVSVMVVQAGAARLVAAQNCADADRALAVIGGCGRDAMVDLRRIVGVLRRTDDPDFGHGAGLGDLGLLTKRIEDAGVPTGLHLRGDMNLPPAVDAVAYRVVQEALTNVVKHAGAGATANVEVRVGPAAVIVEVTNTTVAARPQPTPSGHGLVGMTERVAAYGGDLRVGPRPDGGYGVRAQIPFHPVGPSGVGATVASRRQAMRPSHWMSNRVANVMIVAFWLVVMEIEVAANSARHGPWLLNAAAVAVMALVAGWRRRAPLLFLAVVGGLAVALSAGLTSLDRSTITGLYSLAVPLFTVAAWQPRTQATVGLALWAAGAGSVAVVHNVAADGLAGALVMGVVVWAAGRVWRAQQLLNADLTETTERLAAERDQRAQLAVATERTRIARDLHGPVAHGVITMVVQAEAARKLLVRQPADAEAAIRDIEQTGRDALTQLRRILGVLRSPAGAPTPTTIGAARTPPVARLGEHATWMPEQVLT
jgi:signal transduction histidine kinase